MAMGLASEGLRPTWRRMHDMGLPDNAHWNDRRGNQFICNQVWWEFLMGKTG